MGRVVALGERTVDLDELEADELQAALLVAVDDPPDQLALHAVGLDEDEGPFGDMVSFGWGRVDVSVVRSSAWSRPTSGVIGVDRTAAWSPLGRACAARRQWRRAGRGRATRGQPARDDGRSPPDRRGRGPGRAGSSDGRRARAHARRAGGAPRTRARPARGSTARSRRPAPSDGPRRAPSGGERGLAGHAARAAVEVRLGWSGSPASSGSGSREEVPSRRRRCGRRVVAGRFGAVARGRRTDRGVEQRRRRRRRPAGSAGQTAERGMPAKTGSIGPSAAPAPVPADRRASLGRPSARRPPRRR